MRIELDGKTVYFGTGTGPLLEDYSGSNGAIVFVHGAGFDHSVWVMLARYFVRHGWLVVAPDLPGHGRSEGPALTTVEAMADWVKELIDTTAGGAAVVVGHSMGSLVALSLAQRHGGSVQRLGLLGTSNPMPVGAPLLDAAEDNDHAAYVMANTWSHSTEGRIGSAQNPGVSNYMSGQRWLERNSADTYFADLNACNDFQPGELAITCPTLVVQGDADKMTPLRSGIKVADALGAQMVTLAGSGHALLNEQGNEVLDALSGFLAE